MPYEVDPETYDRVAKNFDFERLADCLETVEEIANESSVENCYKN